jgi:hypothetical protein
MGDWPFPSSADGSANGAVGARGQAGRRATLPANHLRSGCARAALLRSDAAFPAPPRCAEGATSDGGPTEEGTDVGRPRVGARIGVRLHERQLARLDAIVEQRRVARDFSPSAMTRAAVLRELLDQALDGQLVSELARPGLDDDRSRTARSRQAHGGPPTLRDPDADRDLQRHPDG